MSNFLIAFLVGVSVATWVYSKTARRNAGNLMTAVMAAAFCGGLITLFLWITLSVFFK